MMLLRTLWRLCGVAAAVLAWIVIALAISANPWFDVFKHALSDLGGPSANMPQVYNFGLIATGIAICTYSLYIAYASKARVLIFASSLLFTAGIFLMLIGVFPSGTEPHTFVSTWFFIQMLLALVAIALGMTLTRSFYHAIALWIISTLGPVIAILIETLVGWPSVALLEIYGIVLIDIAVLIITTKI